MGDYKDLLEQYKNDPVAAQAEIVRSKQVSDEKRANGDIAGAEAAGKWAGQIRAVQPNVSGADQTVKQAQDQLNLSLAQSNTPAPMNLNNTAITPVTNNSAPIINTTPSTVTNTSPVTNTAIVTPAVTNQPDPNKPVGVRDYLASILQVDPNLIGWQDGVNGQSGRVTVGGTPINIQGLNLNNGSSYATPEQIQAAFQGGVPLTVQNNNAIVNQGMNTFNNALDQFNKTIQTIQATPFTDQYVEHKKALLAQMGKPFEYNPETDLALKQASNLARKNVLATMNARGILNSSITEQGLADVETTLIPQYRQLAFDEYNRQLSNVLQQFGVIQGLTQFDYDQYRDWISQNIDIAGTRLDVAKSNLENMYKVIDLKNTDEQKKIDAKKISIDEAMNRTNLNGYVSNKDAVILGVKPGTLSEAAQQRAAELKQYQEKQKLDYEYQQKQMALEHKYAMSEISARQVVTQQNTEQKAAQKQATDVNKVLAKATPQQKKMYDNYMQIFYATPGNEYYQNPDRVYQRLIGRPDIAEDVGNELYYAMIKQAETSASKVATVKEPNNSNDISFYSSYIDKNFTKKVKDEDTEEISVVQDDNKILNYLENLSKNGVDDNVVRSLLMKYGLPTD